MTEAEMQAEITRLAEELSTLTANSNKLVKEKRDALTRAEKAEAEKLAAEDNAIHANSTELEKAIKRAETAEKASKDAEERAAEVEANLRATRADNALNAALASANIDSKAMPFLVKGFKADIEFSDDGEPMLHSKKVADYIKEFTGPKGEGHQFVRAANNGGGAAVGYTGSGTTASMTKETWNASKFAQMVIDDPEQAKATAIACGKTELAKTL